jgi:hypothetical protein
MPRVRPDRIGTKKLLSAGMAAALVGVVAFPISASAEKGWQLSQYSDYLGAETVLISKNSIKVTADKYGVSLMASAPKFDVLGINDKTHVYYLAEYDNWAKRFKKQSDDMQKSPFQEDGEVRVANVITKRILVDAEHGGETIKAEPGRIAHNTVLFVAPDIKTSPKLVGLLSTIAYVPSTLGFPLRVWRYRVGGTRSTRVNEANTSIIWDTRAIKPADVPDSFAIPKGYTRVDTEMALFIGGDSGGALSAAGGDDIDAAPAVRKAAAVDTDLWAPGCSTRGDDDFFGLGGKSHMDVEDVYAHVREAKSLKGTQHLFLNGAHDDAKAAHDANRIRNDDAAQHAGQWAPGWKDVESN